MRLNVLIIIMTQYFKQFKPTTMNLLRKYYDKDSIGGGIPDEDIIRNHIKAYIVNEIKQTHYKEISRLKDENERLRGEVDIPSAIKVLTKALLEDKSEGSYYYSWQANIAMSFIDEYQRFNPHMSDGNKHILHTIANNAAKNFLDLLCLITPSPTTKK